MAWEVRFFAKERGSGGTPPGAPSPFQAEPDALTHARFLLHRAPDGRVEVFHRGTRRRAVYRLRGDQMVALADPP
jgi:hypothetical protein